MVNRKTIQGILQATALCFIAGSSVAAEENATEENATEENDVIQARFEEALDERESGKIYDAI